jgi:hypothetical protein
VRVAAWSGMSDEIHKNLSLRDALRIAEKLGCTITYPRRHGEVRVWHPSCVNALNINNRRKDAAQRLVSLLRRLSKGTK